MSNPTSNFRLKTPIISFVKRRNIYGGVFIELLILLCIQGILLTCAHFQSHLSDKILARKIVRMISFGRNLSYIDNSPFTLEKEKGRLALKRRNTSFLNLAIKKRGVTLSPSKILFGGAGSNSPARITITGKQRCRITISLRGRISLLCGN